jgi:galactokinase
MSGFARCFGREPDVCARAPGRVNLIGEHVDYNGGSVLPTVLPQCARVELGAQDGTAVHVASAEAGGRAERYVLGEESPRGAWLDYVQGTTKLLAVEGARLGGFDAWIHSEVPIGSGLSSSAALTVALLRALRDRFAIVLDDVALARLAQRVENEFVGARVGIMDPMASSLGRDRQALLLRTKDLAYRYVPIPATIEIVVVDSGQEHRNASGGYNRRRAECEEAARRLEVPLLCDLPVASWGRLASLPPPIDRRARHVVTENERVHAAVAALEGGRLEELGALLDASHRSLRDDFEVSTPEIDALVETLRSREGVVGARLTGGGFGGAVIALARAGAGEAAAREAAAESEKRTGLRAAIVAPPGSLAPAGRA